MDRFALECDLVADLRGILKLVQLSMLARIFVSFSINLPSKVYGGYEYDHGDRM